MGQEVEKSTSSIIESLRPDLMFPTDWNEEEVELAKEETSQRRIRTGLFTAIPMQCRRSCPIINQCPLAQRNQAPFNKGVCPIEMAMVIDFMKSYIKELNVDEDNLVELSMVRDLVDQEIQYIRKNKILASEDLIQENVIGVDNEGRPVVRRELHQMIDFEDKLHRRKKELRNQLLASREARAKLGQTQLNDAQAIANTLDLIRQAEIKKQTRLGEALAELEDENVEDAVIVAEDE